VAWPVQRSTTSTSRGNERKAIFKDDTNRQLFLDSLSQVTERFHWLCHAYCLMDNHYHLVVETPDANLSQGMRQLNRVYTQAYNRRHRRVGHCFKGGSKGSWYRRKAIFSKSVVMWYSIRWRQAS
jgi:putative transposase